VCKFPSNHNVTDHRDLLITIDWVPSSSSDGAVTHDPGCKRRLARACACLDCTLARKLLSTCYGRHCQNECVKEIKDAFAIAIMQRALNLGRLASIDCVEEWQDKIGTRCWGFDETLSERIREVSTPSSRSRSSETSVSRTADMYTRAKHGEGRVG
jgi:hypothetical protein